MSKKSQFEKKLERFEATVKSAKTTPEELTEARNRIISYHYLNVMMARGKNLKKLKKRP